MIAAVNFGRDNKLPIAIRGGGHNGPGLGSVDDGLVIDLSMMKGVRVDPATRTVRVGAGCVTGDVDHATHAFGLAVPFGIISTTGVAGLTLSGGHGYLSRQYGLAIDNLIEADVVLADGSFVTASRSGERRPVLGAARRRRKLRRRDKLSVPHPSGGHDLRRADHLRSRRRRRCDEAGIRQFQPKAAGRILHVPWTAGGPARRSLSEGALGEEDVRARRLAQRAAAEGEKAVNAVRAALPKPIIDWAQPMPYTAMQTLFDPLYPKGLQWYWKGDFVKTLPDAAIDAHLAHAAKLPTELSGMHLYPIDGAVQRRKRDATAWGYRDAAWSMVIFGVDPDPAKAPALKKWARDYWEAVHPFNLAGAYANFMMDDEGESRVKAAYGENYDRLATLKKKYDPTNLFRVNQNIRPAS